MIETTGRDGLDADSTLVDLFKRNVTNSTSQNDEPSQLYMTPLEQVVHFESRQCDQHPKLKEGIRQSEGVL